MPKIQFKRGLKTNLPNLAEGEPAYTTDTKELFIGSSDGNVQLSKKEEADSLQNQINSTNQRLDTLKQVDANAEVLSARGDFPLLGDRLDDVTSSLADKATKTDLGLKRDKSVQIQESDITQDLLNKITGTAPVIAKVTPFSVDYKSTNFFKTTTNLVDKTKLLDGFISYSTGVASANASYKYTDYIPVIGGQVYSQNSNVPHYAWYDANFNYISGSGGVNSVQITAPSNAVYIRLSYPDYKWSTPVLNLGSTLLDYEDFDYRFNEDVLKRLNLNQLNSNVDFTRLNVFITGKNLLNPDDPNVKIGYYVNKDSGMVLANASYYASGFIPVKGLANVVPSFKHQMAWYDGNKNYISGVDNASAPNYAVPSNAVFSRYTFTPATWATAQVEIGTTSTAYEKYKVGFKSPLLKDDLLVFLPPEICVAVGYTIELYNSQVAWAGNLNNYHFQWDCQIGKAMKRKFSVTGTAPLVGTYPLNLTIYDNNMNSVATATTTIKIVNIMTNAVKNVLTIGDSLSNDKGWQNPLRTWSGNNINYVGTRGTAPLLHEGRSGFSAANYLTATTYSTEGVHPFWDGTRFNWIYYKTNTGINPDVVQIFLGTNGIDIDPTVNAGNIKQMIDYIRQDDNLIPIYVVFTLYRGNQDGLGVQQSVDGYAANKAAWKVQEDRKVFNLMTKLYSLLSGYNRLYFVPISLCHDSEYNFGATSTPVNPYASQTELLPVEATHPQQQGYFQFASIMLSTFSAHWYL